MIEQNEFSIAYLLISLLAFSAIGAGLGLGIYRLSVYSMKKRAAEEAQEHIDEAKDRAELLLIDEKEKTQEIETELWAKAEPEMLKAEERIEDLEAIVSEKKSKSDQILNEEKKKSKSREDEVIEIEKLFQKTESHFQSKKQTLQSLNKALIEKLSERSQTQPESLKSETIEILTKEAMAQAQNFIENKEDELKEHLEARAKKLLDVIFDRFARAYCSERGIAPVEFPDLESKKILGRPENLSMLSELTGCDVFVEEEMNNVGVAGFDPVRRELTRRTLERILKEPRSIQPEFIKKCYENCKRELLNLIKRDGDAIAKELRLDNLHPEIRQMMGSLRYRYSFTQNQYFHCGEVGWLAGLLASELNIDIRKARRAGMLHDLGKAMDHSMDGGHAMIGADFIAARGESPEIIHAVRAHHYDEQPATDHAFLVIAADAISGARPGARRSTIESYTQKVTEMESIAKSFDGVVDSYILYGGRECRVIANGRTLTDLQCLELSKKIATKIEAELNYPGQIKVVVVRETIVSESTRVMA
jgi:ribonucrease Y